MFIRKGYLNDDLFKMNIITTKTIDEKKSDDTSSSYLLESCDLWHDKQSHMNYNFIQRLINLDLLLSMIFNIFILMLRNLKLRKFFFPIGVRMNFIFFTKTSTIFIPQALLTTCVSP
jgi:hypothetical protein